jgi:hypothetical protein
MGDRGNIVIKQNQYEDKPFQGVFLYSHWDGSDLPWTLQRALQRKARWNDVPYLARIIFCEMIGNDTGETGYGISTSMCDNEHPLLIVDCEKQSIGLASPESPDKIREPKTFNQFIEMSRQQLETWFK